MYNCFLNLNIEVNINKIYSFETIAQKILWPDNDTTVTFDSLKKLNSESQFFGAKQKK